MYLFNIALFQAFTKILFFVRIFDEYGFLARMIRLTVNEMIPFIIFFFGGSLLFGIFFMILDVELDVRGPKKLSESLTVIN